jgi:hypothetical protein
MVTAIDKRCAQEYRERSAEYLTKALNRLSDLRQPWTEALRSDVQALLLAELAKDWEWLIPFRDREVGERLKDHNTGQISAARDTSHRLAEEELSFLVLREERRKLPLSDLLAAPRYEAVLRHWVAANVAIAKVPIEAAEVTREAVFALEALARLVTGNPTATLGQALQELRAGTDDAGRHILAAIEKIWNFSNTAPSTRHGGGAGDPVSTPEAQFTLGVTGEGIRFLLVLDLST